MALSKAVKDRVRRNSHERNMRLAFGPGLTRAGVRAKLAEMDRHMLEAIRNGKPFGEVFYPTIKIET